MAKGAKKQAKAKPKMAKRNRAKPQPRKAPLQYLAWDSVPEETVNPLFTRRLIHGQRVMIARVHLRKGCVVPEHKHHNEQISYIVEGVLKFWIDGRELLVRAGEVLVIPAHMPHKAEAMEDMVALDTFSPPRADWLKKTDAYLRGGK
jgi:quercetin dioxygenase-like cupin family protein